MESTPTVELVQRAQAGDEQAINDLFARYRDRLRRIARIRVSADLRSSLDGSDLLQEAFVVAYRRFSSFEFRGEGSLIHWLSRILENQVRDAARHHFALKRDVRRAATFEERDDGSAGLRALLADTEATSPSEALERSELTEAYDACVEELDEDQREAVLMRDYAGANWDLIGQQLKRTPDAARELHRRAQIRLSRMLKQRGF